MENEYEYERALIFLERKILVHISRKDGFWCNGILLEVGPSFIVIKDKEGGKEHFIFFEELKHPIEPFKEDKGK